MNKQYSEEKSINSSKFITDFVKCHARSDTNHTTRATAWENQVLGDKREN